MAPRFSLCLLSLALVCASHSALAQPLPVTDQPIPTATPFFLTQGGGEPYHGGQVKAAPPAPLATPRKLGPPLAGPVGIVFAQVAEALALSVIPPTVVEGLKQNPDVLLNLIQYHFIKGFFPAAVLLSAPSGSGESFFRNQTINVTASDGAVFVGVGQPLAKVTHPDVALVPGAFVVHGISKVLTPSRYIFYAVPNPAQTGSILANGSDPAIAVRNQNVTIPLPVPNATLPKPVVP